MQKKLLWLLHGLLYIISTVNAQDKTLSIENVLDIVRKFHPVVKQAALQVDQAANAALASRGVFDPSLQINNERKTFDNKQYFNYNNPELKIPTWYGIDFKAGFENNTGDKLDPSFTLNKSTYVGLSMDPFKGLLYDKRRAAVQQAAALLKLSRQEQKLAVNDILYDATESYWNWVNAFLVRQLLSGVVQNNTARFEFVKQSFLHGDRASIDTTEALAQLQSVQTMQMQAELDLQKTRLLLSNFFWTESNQPYIFGDEVLPDSTNLQLNPKSTYLPELKSLIDKAMLGHPKILALDNKKDFLEIDRKVKTLDLLPSFKLNYNFLDKGYTIPDFTKQFLFQNNYKYGVSFGLPLLQRQARGELAKTKNKIAEIDYSRKLVELEIQNKIKSTYAESTLLLDQVKLTQNNYLNTQKLLEAENAKFNMGESSMFLVNTREMKLIETQQKLILLKTKFFKSLIANEWAAGMLK